MKNVPAPAQDGRPQRNPLQRGIRQSSQRYVSFNQEFQHADDNGQSGLETGSKLWRRRWLIVCSMVLIGAVTALIGLTLPTLYTSEARVLVGVQGPRVPNIDTVLADINPDAERVQDESFVLQSRSLAQQVIERLKLSANPDYNPELNPPSLWARSFNPFNYLPEAYQLHNILPQWLVSPAKSLPATPAFAQTQRANRIVDLFLSRVDVSILGRSHVLSIKASATDPMLAASIANALSDVYLEYQRVEKIHSMDRVDKYLLGRVRELRDQVRVSDQAVQDYRREHGLYKSGNGSVTNQQLTELSTQLISAQTAKVETEARLQEANELRKGGMAGESVPEVLRSPLIASLKQQQAETDRRLAEMTAAYGDRHPLLRNARAEASSLAGRVSAEVAKVVESLARDARTADARYTALRANFANLEGQMGQVNDQSIQLDSLERDATVNRNLLEAVLNRAKQTIGSSDILQANAKMVSLATPAEAPSFPPRKLLVLMGGMIGLLAGAAIALLLESTDRTFRRPEQIEALTGLPVMAMVPQIKTRSVVDGVKRDPYSAFSESLRRLHLGIKMTEARRSSKTMLFTSAAPAEGKSIIVSSLGAMLAASGRKVLLIDCDWRKPRLHHHFRCSNQHGLAHILSSDDAVPDEFIYHDAKTGVDVIPAGDWTPRTAPLIYSEQMRRLLEICSKNYDTVVLDTPPVLLSTDVLALSQMVEKVVFVVRWGHTRRAAVMEALKQIFELQGVVAGIVMSRVVTKRYRQYGAANNMSYEYRQPTELRLR
jgi:succinoglycan biosynthesis transport protein ExoP